MLQHDARLARTLHARALLLAALAEAAGELDRAEELHADAARLLVEAEQAEDAIVAKNPGGPHPPHGRRAG